jgi:hypothetical protein
MTQSCIPCLILALGCLLQFKTEIAAQTAEPARVMILTIDGKDHVLDENKETKIPGTIKDANFLIHPAGYRVFNYSGLNFRYPDKMEFDAEHDGENKTWSLNGNDADLDVLVLDANPDLYIKSSIDMNVEISDTPDQEVKIKKGKRKVNGIELRTYEYSIPFYEDSLIHVWAIELPSRNGRSR